MNRPDGPDPDMNAREPVSADELAAMDNDELVRLGGRLDGVELVQYNDPWPVPDTRAERRAGRVVAGWFLLAAVAGVAFLGVFLFWPWRYEPVGSPGYGLYMLYTPLIGLTLGLAVVGIGVGVAAYARTFLPHEVAVQERHEGGSSDVDKETFVAHVADARARSGIGRRSVIRRSAGLGAGALGLGVGVFAVGGLVRDPWARSEGADSLWHTGWLSRNGERVFLRRDVGDPRVVSLVRPDEVDAGGLETVFPFRESERNNAEALSRALRRSDNPVMLVRLRPEDGARVVKAPGQEDFNFGDYYAYTKICSHLGCPASLYEQRTNRFLCPCHQSQFNALDAARPIFGPATRRLAQLPIDVDDQTGYFYARHDFIEPVGPAFWERRRT
jgi:ubiquinol-cytochrome c reductase iron-sulfur subunit